MYLCNTIFFQHRKKWPFFDIFLEIPEYSGGCPRPAFVDFSKNRVFPMSPLCISSRDMEKRALFSEKFSGEKFPEISGKFSDIFGHFLTKIEVFRAKKEFKKVQKSTIFDHFWQILANFCTILHNFAQFWQKVVNFGGFLGGQNQGF